MVYTDKKHLVADSLDELHAFAEKIGLKREWFQMIARHPHYDLFGSLVDKAIDAGAVVSEREQIVKAFRKLAQELYNLHFLEREFLYSKYKDMMKYDDDREIKINVVTLLDIMHSYKKENENRSM